MAAGGILLPTPSNANDASLQDSQAAGAGANLVASFDEQLTHAMLIPQTNATRGAMVHVRIQESGGGTLDQVRVRLLRNGVDVLADTTFSLAVTVTNDIQEDTFSLPITADTALAKTDFLRLEITLMGIGVGRVFTLWHRRGYADTYIVLGRYE